MALDLGDADLMVDIAPDGKTRFNEGISRDLEDLRSTLTAIVAEDSPHDVTEELNQRRRLEQLQEYMWPLPMSLMMMPNREL